MISSNKESKIQVIFLTFFFCFRDEKPINMAKKMIDNIWFSTMATKRLSGTMFIKVLPKDSFATPRPST